MHEPKHKTSEPAAEWQPPGDPKIDAAHADEPDHVMLKVPEGTSPAIYVAVDHVVQIRSISEGLLHSRIYLSTGDVLDSTAEAIDLCCQYSELKAGKAKHAK